MAYGIREGSWNLRHFQEKWVIKAQALDDLPIINHPSFPQWWAGCRGCELQMGSTLSWGFVLFSGLLLSTQSIHFLTPAKIWSTGVHSLSALLAQLAGPWNTWKDQWEPTVPSLRLWLARGGLRWPVPPRLSTSRPTSNIAAWFTVLERCPLSHKWTRTSLSFQESPGMPSSQTGPSPSSRLDFKHFACAFLQVFASPFPGPEYSVCTSQPACHLPYSDGPSSQGLPLDRLLGSCRISPAPWDINCIPLSLSF